ncbi:MAG: hypothetical protein IPG64_21240 [Haliea sp.]|nr:hypothetical protein [Haliea sp.]
MSGAITWFAYGALLATPFGAEPIWWRPWLQIQAISRIYDIEGGALAGVRRSDLFRNLSAYGIVAMAPVLPGAAAAIVRGSSLERQVALFWLFLVAVLHLTPYKEVRYFAFLALLNAMLPQ